MFNNLLKFVALIVLTSLKLLLFFLIRNVLLILPFLLFQAFRLSLRSVLHVLKLLDHYLKLLFLVIRSDMFEKRARRGGAVWRMLDGSPPCARLFVFYRRFLIMIKHYDDLVFSKIVKDDYYSFSQPTFGKSNTDQSFYEPSGSFFSNQSKIGASSMSHLHNQAENDISEIRKNSSFLPQNMTHEELQAMIIQQQEITESAINDVNEQINVIKDDVNLRNQIVQTSTETTE